MLEFVEGLEILRDLTWNSEKKCWVIYCRLKTKIQHNDLIRATTDWFILIPREYPWGEISIFPAKVNGIEKTFPHQSYNHYGEEEVNWRTGKLCVDTGVRALSRQAFDQEPYEASERLVWRVKRAVKWLSMAAENTLAFEGEPFELPDWPDSPIITALSFLEDHRSFKKWAKTESMCGIVVLQGVLDTGILVIDEFRDAGNNTIFENKWGRLISLDEASPETGIWIRFEQVPVLPPWQAPVNWEELNQVAKMQGRNLYELLEPVYHRIRDGKRHICLIGFPIPERVGEPSSQMFWQPLILPIASHGDFYRKHGGYLKNERGYWARDRMEVLRGNRKIEWLKSENWSKDELSSRGRFPGPIHNKKIAVIGAGALGSCVTEILVRSGVEDLVIVDYDHLSAGNLVRHTLTMAEVNQNKAFSLTKRLNTISPHAKVTHMEQAFHFAHKNENPLDNCDIIVDTTGSDETIFHLENYEWKTERFFVSFSIGLEAKRLFCFASVGETFHGDKFLGGLSPILKQQWQEQRDAGKELPREYLGCWNPVFPARADDIWMLSSVAIKYLVDSYLELPNNPHFVVFQQQIGGNGEYMGVRKEMIEFPQNNNG